VCISGANPCNSSDVGWTVAPGGWAPNQIVATLTTPSAPASSAYDIQVISNGSLTNPDGTIKGFQSTGATQARGPSRGTVRIGTFTISGQVTLTGTNTPVSGVSIGLTDTIGTVYISQMTGSDGRYSWTVNAGGTYTVTPSLFGTYWFTPKFKPFPSLSANQTQNFTAMHLLTVYLLHGIGQDHTAMQSLYENLSSTSGLDPTRFRLDSGFDFSECAAYASCTNSQYGDACGIVAGGKSLAHYILNNPPPGDMIFVGYSMGGLIARDLITNNYIVGSPPSQVISTAHKVVGLITLGTPNLGYPWTSVDEQGFCKQLVDDMAGSWLPQENPPREPLSTYLSTLNQNWRSASYGSYWVAAAGESCSHTVRDTIPGVLPPLQPGCLTGGPSYFSDGVVCHDSAVNYSPGVTLGPPPTSLFEDPQHQYVHTTAGYGLGSSLVLCSNNTTPNPIPLWGPLNTDPLFVQYIVGTINAN